MRSDGRAEIEAGLLGPQSSMTVARAYDALASEYDRQVAGDAWMRRILWERYAAAFRPGQRVLDVGCGTGTDAIFLAGRGFMVTAIDVSPAMIARAERKAADHGFSDRIHFAVLDIAELANYPRQRGETAADFDGIISSFAALNALPTWSEFAADAARLLRPNGRMILHLLNGSSLWEWTHLVARGWWTEAWKLRRRRERTFSVDRHPVRHYLPRADEAYARYFAPYFRLCGTCGLGILRPPLPPGTLPKAVLTALGRVDELLGPHRPFVDWGRFVFLEMTRRQ